MAITAGTRLHFNRRTAGRYLSAGPVVLPFAAYAVWWALGIGDFVWLIAGFVVALSWIRVRGLRMPAVFLLWVFFLAWAGVTLVMNDNEGRFFGAIYRLSLYMSAGLLAVYTYNARYSLSVWRVTGAMVWFLAGMTVCGYLALAFPEATLRTPMAWIMPDSLASNELVGQMVVRQMSSWNPDAWVEEAVRLVAPFLYANTWGNVYSLVLPMALLNLWLVWRTRYRWPVLLVIAASVYPALSTLNRGMFVGLAIVAAWVLIQMLRRGWVLAVGASLSAIAAAGAIWYFSPLGAAMLNRVETTSSIEDRGQLYRTTLEAVLQSPLFGYGSPRPAESPWLPSLGTQGQLWTVLYSHGFVGAVLFTAFFVAVCAIVLRRGDVVGVVLGGIILATLAEMVFYGMMTGIMVTMIAVALALRTDTVISSEDRPGTGARRSATHFPRGRV